MSITDLFDWDSWSLIPAVVQDPASLQVLMVGFMNREALEKTAATGRVTFFSRSRNTLWTKGETSGNVLTVRELRINCEENSLLVFADPTGPTCHTGHQSCYFRRIEPDGSLTTILPLIAEGDSGSGASKLGPEEMTRRWYGAYTYLRDHDLAAASGTSKRLRSGEFAFEQRVGDELAELAGVIDGSHVHQGLPDDLLLEGSQVAYWIACAASAARVSWDDLRPELALTANLPAESAESMAETLRTNAEHWNAAHVDRDELLANCYATFGLIANAALTLGVEPIALIEHDLADLQSRDYLAPYFA